MTKREILVGINRIASKSTNLNIQQILTSTMKKIASDEIDTNWTRSNRDKDQEEDQDERDFYLNNNNSPDPRDYNLTDSNNATGGSDVESVKQHAIQDLLSRTNNLFNPSTLASLSSDEIFKLHNTLENSGHLRSRENMYEREREGNY